MLMVMMQVSTSRQLSPKHKGELTWVVGPPHARAMVLGVTSRFKTFQTAVSLEVCSPGASRKLRSVLHYWQPTLLVVQLHYCLLMCYSMIGQACQTSAVLNHSCPRQGLVTHKLGITLTCKALITDRSSACVL